MVSLHDHQTFFRKRGPLYEGDDALPSSPPATPAVRYIAYYLPQFHPFEENDAWWGRGFTEWTNVAGGLPRYVGHYQPRIPADLGFYDLRDVETLRRQAALAKRGGIHGFCFHNYWFSGKRLLERPLDLLLANTDIDLPFCLNWANESWTRRWDGSETDILIEQRYAPGEDVAYAESILPALADPRYIKIDGRPLLMIYHPSVMPDARRAVDAIRARVVRAGLPEPYIIMPHAFDQFDPRVFGMDATAGFAPHPVWYLGTRFAMLKLLDKQLDGRVVDYRMLAKAMLEFGSTDFPFFPGVCPMWDNEARKGRRGSSFYGSTPARYGQWLRAATRATYTANTGDTRLLFINAWNEWAEGAYLEPDRHFGHAYLAETRRALDDFQQMGADTVDDDTYPPADFSTTPSPRNVPANLLSTALRKVNALRHKNKS